MKSLRISCQLFLYHTRGNERKRRFFQNAQRKHQGHPKSQRAFPAGAGCQGERGAANRLEVGARAVGPRRGHAAGPVGSPGDTGQRAAGRNRCGAGGRHLAGHFPKAGGDKLAAGPAGKPPEGRWSAGCSFRSAPCWHCCSRPFSLWAAPIWRGITATQKPPSLAWPFTPWNGCLSGWRRLSFWLRWLGFFFTYKKE